MFSISANWLHSHPRSKTMHMKCYLNHRPCLTYTPTYSAENQAHISVSGCVKWRWKEGRGGRGLGWCKTSVRGRERVTSVHRARTVLFYWTSSFQTFQHFVQTHTHTRRSRFNPITCQAQREIRGLHTESLSRYRDTRETTHSAVSIAVPRLVLTASFASIVLW